MIIREWQGHGQYSDIEVIITASRKGWQALATGSYQPVNESRFPIDAVLEVTTRSEPTVLNTMEDAIRGKEVAMMQIVQWAITACMVRDEA